MANVRRLRGLARRKRFKRVKVCRKRRYLNQHICSEVASNAPLRLHMLSHEPQVEATARVPVTSLRT